MELEEMAKLIKKLQNKIEICEEDLAKVKEVLFGKPEFQITLDKTKEEFDSLYRLLHSNNWPRAIDPSLICDTTLESDKEDRAEGILEIIIDTEIKGLKFLDFGCGEGHVINKSTNKETKLSIGFDINKSEKWETWPQKDNVIFTDDWEKVLESGPYDVILLYDVLDHTKDPVEILKRVKTVCTDKTKVYIRCHPFCSRHGTHLYKQINKAFVHLVFTKTELEAMGFKEEEVFKVIHPQLTYHNWLEEAGFTNKTISAYREAVESFFSSTPIIANRIKRI